MKAKSSSNVPFSRTVPMEEFTESINALDLISSLMTLQKLGARMGEQAMTNVNIEFEFYATPSTKLKTGTLTRDFISFTAKQLLLNCGNSDVRCNDLDLVNLVYGYGNLQTDLDQMKDPVAMREKGWLWVIRATNQQWWYQRYYSMIIGRYYWIFTKIFEQEQSHAEILNSVLGMNVIDAMKIGTCIYANYCPRENGQFADSFLMASYTNTTVDNLKSLLTEENILKFLDVFSITPEDFREESKKYEIADPLLKKYEFNPLRRYPVVRTNSDEEVEKFIIPSLADFLFSCFEGLYYVMLDRLGENDKRTFWKTLGTIFEEYIGELIKYYDIESLSAAHLIDEQVYLLGKNELKTADWILLSETYIIQIECKKRRINNYARAGVQSADGSGIESILDDIVEITDKLIRKEDHIRKGAVASIPYSGQAFINVVVFLDEMFAFNQHARGEIRQRMEEQSDNFFIFGCYEFEMACQQCRNSKKDMASAIEDVASRQAEMYKIDFLDDVYSRFFTELMGSPLPK